MFGLLHAIRSDDSLVPAPVAMFAESALHAWRPRAVFLYQASDILAPSGRHDFARREWCSHRPSAVRITVDASFPVLCPYQDPERLPESARASGFSRCCPRTEPRSFSLLSAGNKVP